MNLVRARPNDAAALTAIAFAAKRYWGYPENWIRQWADDLTITSDYLATHPTFAAAEPEGLVGVCGLGIEGKAAELDFIWILPTAMGRGIGRALFIHAATVARTAGAVTLHIVSDPHAAGFYRRMGASVCGEQAAPMNGVPRFLPLLTLSLDMVPEGGLEPPCC